MKKTFVSVLLVLALTILIVPAASAQDGFECFNLSPEDCAILAVASANSDSIVSFVQDFSLDINATGLEVLQMFAPEVPSAVSFSVSGSGPFTLLLGEEIPLAFSVPMDVQAIGVMDNLSASFPLAITDGYLFIPMEDEVVGIPLTEAFLNELGIDLSDLATDPVGSAQDGFGDVTGMLGLEGMGEESPFDAYISLDRLADANVMGDTMYPFRLGVDVGGILNSPEFQEVFGMLSTMGMEETGGMEGMEELGMVLMLVPMLLEGVEADIAVTQYVDPAQEIVRKLTVEIDLLIDLSMLFGFGAPEGAEMPEMDPMDINIVFDVELSNVNEAVTVEAPAGARLLTEQEAEALMNEMGTLLGGF